MGEVYRARDTKLGRDVALKVLPDTVASDPDRLARFQREARVLASLNHPNIGAIHGLEESADTTALVLELVEGPTLAELGEGGMSLDEALPVARQIAEALGAAHAKGIVHRDLKPANIKLRPDGTVKVLDFGLAREVPGAAGGARLPQGVTLPTLSTVDGAILGTPAYMSPERLRGQSIDTRCDIWAFGCVLYELLAGKKAFGGETLFDTVAAILERTPDWQALPVATPPGVRTLLQRCMEAEPSQRPPDTAAIASELAGATRGTTAAQAGLQSIAVLPFADLSPEQDQEYFCEGLAEELIDALTKLDGLRVVARTSTFQFKSREADAAEIGVRLRVQTILHGSVRRAGSRLRVNAQLINAVDGYHLWSERYDRLLDDVFTVQDEIARAVAGKLQVTLLGESGAPLVQRPTHSLEAYQCYMQGRYHRFTRYEPSKAMECYEAAVRHDPGYAAAWAGIADTAVTEAVVTLCPPAEASVRAREAIERALALGDGLSEVHDTLGRIRHCLDWRWDDAERGFTRALELNPANAEAHTNYATYLGIMGRVDEALAEVAHALESDPLSLRARTYGGVALLMRRRYQEGIARCREVLDLQPEYRLARWWLSLLYLASGQCDEAVSCLRVVTAPHPPIHVGFLGAALACAGHLDEARGLLRSLEDRRGREYVSPYVFARLHVGLGEIEAAVECLEAAYTERCPTMLNTQGPFWDPIRDHPRGDAVLRRLNLPDLRSMA